MSLIYSSNDAIDIIKLSVSDILQNRINSRIANNEDAKDLINIFNQIQTVTEFLMQFIKT